MSFAKFLRAIFFVCLFGGTIFSASGQSISMDWLINLTTEPADKQAKSLGSKKFIRSGGDVRNDSTVTEWTQSIRKRKKGKFYEERTLSTFLYQNDAYVRFKTSDEEEYNESIDWLNKKGFKVGNDTSILKSGKLFQKENIAVQTFLTKEDTVDIYHFFVWNLYVPSYSEVGSAEDLLQFRSHELLSSFYGRQNVRSDLYYFSKDEVNKCSILYPNSPKQVVFLWKDEDNLFGLSNIIIGGSVRTEGTSDFNSQIRENTWKLKNGIGINTGLEKVIDVNGNDMKIFGRNTDYYLTIVPQNSGTIDGFHTGFVMDCINCQGSSLLDKKEVSAMEALNQSLRMHVGLIILMPPTPKAKSPGS